MRLKIVLFNKNDIYTLKYLNLTYPTALIKSVGMKMGDRNQAHLN